jgi:hypothetical protein
MLISREFGDEVVIANYETGIYYSLGDSAARIWLALTAGYAAEEVAERLAAAAGPDGATVRASVNEFIDRLQSEGIIVPADGVRERLDFPLTASEPFKPPVIERFDDLQDLLLLDPVHDVGDTGWPTRVDDAN